jgi:DNA topoisomerase-1
MKLVIVESPHKSITISRYLGDGYKVLASQGHIRDLSSHGKGGLGIDCEHGFKPDWVISEDKKDIVSKLRKEAKKADEVLLATDPDREGEAISWHLSEVLGLDLGTTKRLSFHEVTKPAILEAIENPKTIDMHLVESQMARRMYDRIIGFKLSSLMQKKVGAQSAGRVQSATLKMIVDNHKERLAFKPEEYWTISVILDVNGQKLEATLAKVDGKAPKIKNKEEA